MYPAHLQTEYATDPLGIDAIPPRFSWRLAESQTAYQILAASAPARLAQDQGDLWDSGRVSSPEHRFVPYAGTPLVSGQRVYWQVRTWNDAGRMAASAPAWFEMGLLRQEDWQGSLVSAPRRGIGGRGYHSDLSRPGHPLDFWVQVDLEAQHTFDRIVLHPCNYLEQGPAGPGFGFPVRFQILGSNAADCGNPSLLFETTADIPNPGVAPFEIRLPAPAMARYVRLAVTTPYSVPGGIAILALDEFQIFKGDINLALHKPVAAANDLITMCDVQAGSSDWDPRCLTDGVIQPDPPRMEDGQGNLLRRTLTLDKPVAQARAYIGSFGWYELRINGHRVGDAVLDSGWTSLNRRILYSTWDVTDLIKSGVNVVTVLLGAGWVLDPAFILQLNVEHTDGTLSRLCSDGQWRRLPSPVRENHVFHGECYDARRERPEVDDPAFDDRTFPVAPTRTRNTVALSAQMHPPIRVVAQLEPARISEPQPGTWIFDLGQNIAGWARLRVQAEPGREITLRFAESIFDDGSVWTSEARTQARQEGRIQAVDGTINAASTGNARATDRYLCRGDGQEETWEPRFTYHGFRFVQATGLPQRPDPTTITGCVVRTDVRSIGKFNCSNETLNWAYEASRWSLANNLHSVPTDCCQRAERQGWMGDAQFACEAMLCNFDAASTYIKWFQDMRDEQRADGAIGDTVPYSFGRFGGDPAWGSAIVLIPWYVHLYTGDRRVLESHFDAMHRYMDYLDRTHPSHVVENNTYGGDWLATEETPPALTNTGFLLLSARLTAQCATLLGRPDEAQRWERLAQETATVFHQRFFNAADGSYGTNSQFSNVWALYLDLVPPELRTAVFAQVTANIEKRGRHLSTGAVGTRYLLDVLSHFGRPDLAVAVLTAPDFPGYGYMRARGATTMWENWRDETRETLTSPSSQDHAYLGQVAAWLMKRLAGIRPDPAQPGFRHIWIEPQFPTGLDHAEGELESQDGPIRSAWRRQGNRVRLEVEVPPNCTATLSVRNVKSITNGPLSSGQHTFTINLPPTP